MQHENPNKKCSVCYKDGKAIYKVWTDRDVKLHVKTTTTLNQMITRHGHDDPYVMIKISEFFRVLALSLDYSCSDPEIFEIVKAAEQYHESLAGLIAANFDKKYIRIACGFTAFGISFVDDPINGYARYDAGFITDNCIAPYHQSSAETVHVQGILQSSSAFWNEYKKLSKDPHFVPYLEEATKFATSDLKRNHDDVFTWYKFLLQHGKDLDSKTYVQNGAVTFETGHLIPMAVDSVFHDDDYGAHPNRHAIEW